MTFIKAATCESMQTYRAITWSERTVRVSVNCAAAPACVIVCRVPYYWAILLCTVRVQVTMLLHLNASSSAGSHTPCAGCWSTTHGSSRRAKDCGRTLGWPGAMLGMNNASGRMCLASTGSPSIRSWPSTSAQRKGPGLRTCARGQQSAMPATEVHQQAALSVRRRSNGPEVHDSVATQLLRRRVEHLVDGRNQTAAPTSAPPMSQPCPPPAQRATWRKRKSRFEQRHAFQKGHFRPKVVTRSARSLQCTERADLRHLFQWQGEHTAK